MAQEEEVKTSTYTLNQIAIITIGSIVLAGFLAYGVATLINKSKK